MGSEAQRLHVEGNTSINTIASVNTIARVNAIEAGTTIKELLLRHSGALRVLLARGVPVSCAQGTIADAARACGTSPESLLAELRATLGEPETSRVGTGVRSDRR